MNTRQKVKDIGQKKSLDKNIYTIIFNILVNINTVKLKAIHNISLVD